MTPEEIRVQKEFAAVRKIAKGFKDVSDFEKPELIKRFKPKYGELANYMFEDSGYSALKYLLTRIGRLYRTDEGQLLFFRFQDKKLYELEERQFELYMIELTGNVTGLQKQWLPRLSAFAEHHADTVMTHFLAYNDSPDLDVIALNTFDGQMMRRKRHGKWERMPNGTDGILFLTPMEFLTPWTAEYGSDGRELEWLCSLGNFSSDNAFSVADQQVLLAIWILHLFVPEWNPVHPIPLFEGIAGSGKSVMGECIGRLIAGPQFEVMDLPTGQPGEAEKSVTLELCKRPLVVLDNVDSYNRWLEDFLCRYATGVRMSRRRLYTDSDQIHFVPKAGLILTSRTPRFRREDVARRILPIQFNVLPLKSRRRETLLRSEVQAKRNAIWGDILGLLAKFQDASLANNGQEAEADHSLADFSIFGKTLMDVAGWGKRIEGGWKGLMKRLDRAQSTFTAEEDMMADVIWAILTERKYMAWSGTSQQLHYDMVEKAKEMRLFLPCRGVTALTKQLKAKRPAIEQTLNVKIDINNKHHGRQTRIQISANDFTTTAPPPHGDDGEGNSCNSVAKKECA